MAKLQSRELRSSEDACPEAPETCTGLASLISAPEEAAPGRQSAMAEYGRITALDINVLLAAQLLAGFASDRSTADLLIDGIEIART